MDSLDDETEYCEVVDVLGRKSRVPRIPSFFAALKDSPSLFDAAVDRTQRGWDRVDFLLRGRRGVRVEAHRARVSSFKDRIRDLFDQASRGYPTRARSRVIRHLDNTRILYRLMVHEWVESDEDWTFVYMLGNYLCEQSDAILHNSTEGFVDPGEGRLLRPS